MEEPLSFKGLKATNERQDNWGRYIAPSGTIPYRPSILYIYIYTQGAHAPLCPCKTQRDKVLAAKQVGPYVPLNPQRGS